MIFWGFLNAGAGFFVALMLVEAVEGGGSASSWVFGLRIFALAGIFYLAVLWRCLVFLEAGRFPLKMLLLEG